MPTEQVYEDSTALKKLRLAHRTGRTLRLAFLDIDGTLTGQASDQVILHHQLNELGYVTVSVSARTAAASQHAEDRLQGLLDADIIIGSLGSQIAVKQANESYRPDLEYAQKLSYKGAQWHRHVAQILLQLASLNDGHSSWQTVVRQEADILLQRAAIESAPYWVRLEFSTARDYTDFLTAARQQPGLACMDESTPYSQVPAFVTLITPPEVNKQCAADYIAKTIVKMLGITPSTLEVFIAGDGPSDLAMGLQTASGASTTFLIPGGARVARYIQEKNVVFLGGELADLADQLVPVLEHNGAKKPGYYRHPIDSRLVIIGDEVFPETTGPETLVRWFNLL